MAQIGQLPSKAVSLLVKSIVLVVVLFLSETLLWLTGTSFPTFAAISLIDLVVFITAAVFLFVGIKCIVHGYFRIAIPLLLIIPLLMVSFAQPSTMLFDRSHFGYSHDLAYLIKLTLNEKQYLEEIELIKPNPKGFRYDKFRWFTEPDEWTDLVYDESDEVWLSHLQNYDGCPYTVNRIKSHFYAIRVTCS